MNHLIVLTIIFAITLTFFATSASAESPYAKWENGPSTDPSFFPIACWYQNPNDADKYLAAGFNVYIYIGPNPTQQQLDTLRDKGMQVICAQTDVALENINLRFDDGRPVIIGWIQEDEPDNAAESVKGSGNYDRSVMTPAESMHEYKHMKKNDPTRPVYLGLSQGIGNPDMVWKGQGGMIVPDRDYPKYSAAADIVAYDIYPYTASDTSPIKNKPWLVPLGVDRLKKFAPDKIIWNVIGCTNFSGRGVGTPTQVKAMAWMSIIHGSMGISHFVHVFTPNFVGAGLFLDKEMTAAVTAMHKQIHALAPVLNSPTIEDVAEVKTSDENIPVDVLVKQFDGATYLFAVPMRDGQVSATFTIKGIENATAQIIDENREIKVVNGTFTDDFSPYQVHLYRIK